MSGLTNEGRLAEIRVEVDRVRRMSPDARESELRVCPIADDREFLTAMIDARRPGIDRAPLKTDPNRSEAWGGTGIFVRAQGADGRPGSFDIACLDKTSLLSWLRSRGGDNRWAEDTVGQLLGHGPLHEPTGGAGASGGS